MLGAGSRGRGRCRGGSCGGLILRGRRGLFRLDWFRLLRCFGLYFRRWRRGYVQSKFETGPWGQFDARWYRRGGLGRGVVSWRLGRGLRLYYGGGFRRWGRLWRGGHLQRGLGRLYLRGRHGFRQRGGSGF